MSRRQSPGAHTPSRFEYTNVVRVSELTQNAIGLVGVSRGNVAAIRSQQQNNGLTGPMGKGGCSVPDNAVLRQFKRRRGGAPLRSMAVCRFAIEQHALALHAPGVARKRAIVPHHAMARNGDARLLAISGQPGPDVPEPIDARSASSSTTRSDQFRSIPQFESKGRSVAPDAEA